MSKTRMSRMLAACLLCAATSVSVAAGWPDKPVRVIVVYPPGGVSDTVTRAISEELSVRLKTPFVVENKGGAGGTVGMAAVAKADADGYTIGFSSISPLALSPLISKVAYDPGKDIAPVASVMVSPVVLLGTSAFKGKSIHDVISQSKTAPGSLRWATSGPGSVGHLMLEQFQHDAEVSVTHVPYKGSAQQQNDALGGQFELISTNVSSALIGHIERDALRAIAIAAPKRAAFLPEVPTFSELGYARANKMSVFGFFAPGGTPDAIVTRLNTEINEVVAMPKIQELLKGSSNIPMSGTPQDFSKAISEELQSNRQLIGSAGLKLQ